MGGGKALQAPSRRAVLGLLSSACILPGHALQAQAPARPGPGRGFGYEDVVERAKALAKQPFDAASATIPSELSKLTYDSYREVRFRRDKAFWREGGSDFRLLPFHLGFLHDKPVQIHLIDHGTAVPIPFTTGLFEYGKVPVPKGLSPALGFAGFTVTTNLNDPKVQDEVVSFLGASYFRLIGRGHRYGLSARSLALDVGGQQPEEFPFMRALWVEEPTPDTTELVIYALVDSPSVTAAFRYAVSPGLETHMDITATIIPRREIERIGIAPLTSMFQAGEGDLGLRTDFRPEIHDSDGLMMNSGSGEWIWRPLRNPKALRISSFHDKNPRGFGLMQRDREFGSYQDLEARYDARPGYWVQPQGDWGEGRIDLVEIPTDNEAFDNIVACWTPNIPLPTGQATELRYRISALSTTSLLHPYAQVHQSFAGSDIEDGVAEGQGRKRFIVDFAGGDLAYYQGAPDRLELVATTTGGAITTKILTYHAPLKGVRAIVDATLPDGQSAELRMFIKTRNRTLSETWTATWSVPPGDTARAQVPQAQPARQ
ncbi:glucan biosynthesis protein G [Bosea sp. TND4EK4]|uniref:glucan biosynthesis protein n=1 Tax=Bosea sp. TND4EK4 TaxID=1907408 RepID=UPI000953B3A8|nr:glucan biosynthesis protein G [Bosea sp. TND4EK4]SIR39855.1 glucans biosynthesis protein [Bosea sp. TND4EK4]